MLRDDVIIQTAIVADSEIDLHKQLWNKLAQWILSGEL